MRKRGPSGPCSKAREPRATNSIIDGIRRAGENCGLPLAACDTSRAYWIGKTKEARVRLLLEQWSAIRDGLPRDITGTQLDLDLPSSWPLFALKRFEDALDALICAWVGTNYFGDEESATWIPEIRVSRPNHDRKETGR